MLDRTPTNTPKEIAPYVDALDTKAPFRGVLFPGLVGDVLQNAPEIRTTMFMGAHPTRPEAGPAERRTIRYIHDVVTQVSGKPSVFQAIMADTHAIHNGIPKDHIRAYLESVAATGKAELGDLFQYYWLSDLYEQFGLNLDEARLMTEAQKHPDLLMHSELKQALLRGAANRGGDWERAQLYLGMRLQETPIIETLTPEDQGLFLVIGEETYATMFEQIARRGTIFTRARHKGGGNVNHAPWIPFKQ